MSYKDDTVETMIQLTKFHFSFKESNYDTFRKYSEKYNRDKWY
jgi:hypothetical protein